MCSVKISVSWFWSILNIQGGHKPLKPLKHPWIFMHPWKNPWNPVKSLKFFGTLENFYSSIAKPLKPLKKFKLPSKIFFETYYWMHFLFHIMRFNWNRLIWSFLDCLIVKISSTIVKKGIMSFNWNKLIWGFLNGLNVKISSTMVKKGIMRFNWNRLIWDFLYGLNVKFSSIMVKKEIMRLHRSNLEVKLKRSNWSNCRKFIHSWWKNVCLRLNKIE